MNTTIQNNASEQVGLSAKRTANLLGISERHLWALHAAGKIPMPVKLGRAVRWNRSEVLAWMGDGAPARDAWEAQKARGNQ